MIKHLFRYDSKITSDIKSEGTKFMARLRKNLLRVRERENPIKLLHEIPSLKKNFMHQFSFKRSLTSYICFFLFYKHTLSLIKTHKSDVALNSNFICTILNPFRACVCELGIYKLSQERSNLISK